MSDELPPTPITGILSARSRKGEPPPPLGTPEPSPAAYSLWNAPLEILFEAVRRRLEAGESVTLRGMEYPDKKVPTR